MENNVKLENSEVGSEAIRFIAGDSTLPILKLCKNGDIFVKGKLIENDIEVVEALREFFKKANS